MLIQVTLRSKHKALIKVIVIIISHSYFVSKVGTKITHRQNPDITECTCLTKPWRQRFFQCFTRTDIPPDCPVHSSEGSTVGKEANSNEKQRTSRPGRVRRFGRWIAKRVTKGKREEPEEATLAISATDNCVAPESTDITTADEFSPAPESHMLLYYVRTAAAGYTGSKATGINETNEDTTDSVAQTKEKKTELDNNSMKPKSKQTTVMSLKELCKAVVAYSDGLNLYTYNLELDDTEALEYHEINEPEQDSTSLTSEVNESVLMTLVQLSTNVIDNNQDTATDVAHPKATIEPDNTSLYSELDKSVLTILVQLSTSIDSSQDVAQPKAAIKPDNTRLRSEFDKSVLTILVQLSTSIDSSQDVAQPIATNTELDTNNEKNEEMYQNTIMSLKEMCEAVVAYSGDMKPNTDNSKSEDTEGLDNHDTNKPEQDNTNLTTDEKRVAVEQILSAKSLLCLAEKKFNEDGFQREMYFHTNRDAKTDSSLTQSHIYTISDKVHQESICIRRRQIKKSKKVWSHGREKASRGKYNIAELLGLVCNPMETSKNIENNNIILAAKKKQSDGK